MTILRVMLVDLHGGGRMKYPDVPANVRMVKSIPELERIFVYETGFHDLPRTSFRLMGSRYLAEPPTIIITKAKKYPCQRDYGDFTWLHEAYHHYDHHYLGNTAYEPERATINKEDDEYLEIPSEREANAFAYHICLKHGLPIPDWMPSGYLSSLVWPLRKRKK